MMKNQSDGKGAKLTTTIIMWLAATGMLGICIPLVSITESGAILPVAIVIGVSLSTIFVWWSGNLPTKKLRDIDRKFSLLEARTKDLETIYSQEDFDIVRKFDRPA